MTADSGSILSAGSILLFTLVVLIVVFSVGTILSIPVEPWAVGLSLLVVFSVGIATHLIRKRLDEQHKYLVKLILQAVSLVIIGIAAGIVFVTRRYSWELGFILVLSLFFVYLFVEGFSEQQIRS